jgi:glycosyltransferase involved in cell wall biosynthesis
MPNFAAMQLSVIVTTYNSPDWLEKVLWGFETQSYKDFEVVIADDGSGAPTKERIERMRREVSYPIQHVWHEDIGFRKCTILNHAIEAAKTDYLVFTDGDCIPRKDFMQVHAERREKGHFLSGGYFKLPMDISKEITKDDILNQRCFELKWLKDRGLPISVKNSKISFKGGLAEFMNAITPTKATWNGHNASGWKEDILAVNGYDERMRYGALDRELGERLMNKGIKGIQIRYSAICLHLDHSRGYKNNRDIDFNKGIRKTTAEEKRTWTDFGIRRTHQFPADPEQAPA